ncbi:hypothetical protein P280DRAFT_545678 [Massarina eburnea CBS 473.64]|uniref:Uncharacterized protein n=1 Tax=Massarina eburnea CBS 473.64 TaxID=1395130 RepID=A0A6A6SD47_9PLEO|nr:hypothetical protein P280DRAFT_545678 [Massarina eburnea CBS 473.64]
MGLDCIEHLDPEYILVLANTAWYHQVDVLRDAIYKHLDRETSIRVHFPLPRYNIFRLEFHFDRLILDEVPLAILNARQNKQFEKGNTLFDLGFLGLVPKRGKAYRHIIHQLHISLIVCGWDHSRWAAYAFTNSTQKQDNGNTCDNDDDNSEASDEEDAGDTIEPSEDALAANASYVLDANNPIWDPRTYWLVIISEHIRIMVHEWKWLVHHLEEGVNDWGTNHPISCFSKTCSGQCHNMNESLAWTVQTKEILNELREKLVTQIGALKTFCSSHGDAEYFTDLDDPRATAALGVCKESCLEFTNLEKKMGILHRRCDELGKHLRVILNYESNQVTLESNRVSLRSYSLNEESHRVALETQHVALANNLNAALMLSTNQFLAPVIVVTSYFSTQDKIFGFSRNATSFLVCVGIVFVVLRVVILTTFLTRKFVKLRGILACIVLGQWDQLEGRQQGVLVNKQQQFVS